MHRHCSLCCTTPPLLSVLHNTAIALYAAQHRHCSLRCTTPPFLSMLHNTATPICAAQTATLFAHLTRYTCMNLSTFMTVTLMKLSTIQRCLFLLLQALVAASVALTGIIVTDKCNSCKNAPLCCRFPYSYRHNSY